MDDGLALTYVEVHDAFGAARGQQGQQQERTGQTRCHETPSRVEGSSLGERTDE